MRRLGLALTCAFVLAAAGCGASGRPRSTASPGQVLIDALVAGTARADPDSVWKLLTPASQLRLGRTEEGFSRGPAKQLERRLLPFRDGRYRTVVATFTSSSLGVVAVAEGSAAYAIPFRRQPDGRLLAVLGSGVTVEPLSPTQGARLQPPGRVAARVRHANLAISSEFWLDGTKLSVSGAGTPADARFFANIKSSPSQGLHVVVALIHLLEPPRSSRPGAAARAWTFTVR